MSNLIGKCPFCKNGEVSYSMKNINGRKTKLYSCSNNKVKTEDGEYWEKTEDSTCDFKIFGNVFQKYGKKFLGPKEVKRLLENKDTICIFHSKQTKKEYKKYIQLNEQYGVSVIWDVNIEENEEELETN